MGWTIGDIPTIIVSIIRVIVGAAVYVATEVVVINVIVGVERTSVNICTELQ